MNSMKCDVCKGYGKIETDDGAKFICISCTGTGKKNGDKWCPECDGIMAKSAAGGWVCFYGCQK